jgi:thiamine-phosphate pyrophosphorylase
LSPAPDNSNSSREASPTAAPILCYVTDGKLAASGNDSTVDLALRRKIRDAIDAGVDWIQIREKDLPARELFTLVHEAVSASESQNGPQNASGLRSKSAETKIIVNDRLDIALAAGAAGVHLGGESAPLAEVVRWCRNGNAPREFMIGASCHSLADARETENAGANYIFFGPVFDTPSKRAFGQPVGIEQLALVCAALKIPMLAIGGVDTQNAHECVRAGAAGIAAIRMFQDAADVEKLRSTVKLLRDSTSNSARR